MASRPLLFSMYLEELTGVGNVTEKLEQASITRLNAEGHYGDAKTKQPRKKASLAQVKSSQVKVEQHVPMFPPLS